MKNQPKRTARRRQVVEEIKNGTPKAEIAGKLQVSRMTLWRDLTSLDTLFTTENSMEVKELKRRVGQSLLDAADAVWEGEVPPKVVDAWRGVMSDFSKLLGLNAESRSVVAHVSTERDATYLKFKKSVSGLSEDQLDQVFRFAVNLPREKKPSVKDESWFPTPEPKLLEEGNSV